VELVILLLALALLAIVIAVIGAPLRSAAAAGQPSPAAREHDDDADRAELEAERETKYREIRDAELDFRTGKLSAADHAAIDAALRAEALDILNRLEALGVDRERRQTGPSRGGAGAGGASHAPGEPAAAEKAEPEVEP
jgi:hypothetical protein